jgi:putative nucleotidyltransferase with HDIG domain/PAS domain S-box-containing protein
MLGYKHHEIENSFSGWKNLWHPDDGALIEKSMQDYLSGKTEHFEAVHRLRHKDGGWRWILTRGDVIRDALGKPFRWVGTNLDITEQRLMEQALRESESLKIREEMLEHNLAITKNALRDMVSILARIVELRDPSTAGHHIRVARLATAMAKKMGLPEEQNIHVQTAAMLHDIGRIYISTELLSKTGPLIDLEYKMVQTHAQKGYDTVRDVDFQSPIAEIIYQHHERMDGSGYPRKLKGSEILTEARILAVAEVVDAMLTHRPYRQAPGIEKALQELSSNKGIKYDNAAVDACLELFQREDFDFRSE